VVDTAPATEPDAVLRTRATNPWMVGLTLLWCAVLAVALLLVVLGGRAEDLGYDQPNLPPSDVLAGIYYAASGVAAAVAVLLIGVQVAVRALLWHLDPSSRTVPAPQDAAERLPRQDF
jgi:hypothetical protein